MNTKGKGESGRAIIGIVLVAIVLASVFAVIMPTTMIKPASADIMLIDKGVVTEIGDNTTIYGWTQFMNFTANDTGDFKWLNLTFPSGFDMSNVSNVTDIYLTNLTNVTQSANITVGASFINISNATAAKIFNAAANTAFSVNITGNFSVPSTPGTYSINLTTSNTSDEALIYLTVKSHADTDTATVTPTAVVHKTVRDYNLTITNVNSSDAVNEIVNNIRIDLSGGFSYSGNASDVSTNATGSTIVNTGNASQVNITSVNIGPNESIWVNIKNVEAAMAGGTGKFKVYMWNATDPNWRSSDGLEANVSVGAADVYGGAPYKLEVQFNYGNWTIGEGAVNITVQAHDANGNLTNASSAVYLKITSDNWQYANLLPEDGIVMLVNGTNSSATINVTDATQAGDYTVTAYDLNETETPMLTDSDTITYAVGTAGPATQYTVTANKTSAALGETVLLNITFKDANGLPTEEVTGTYTVHAVANSSDVKFYSLANYSYPDGRAGTVGTEEKAFNELQWDGTGIINCTIKSLTVGTYNITVECIDPSTGNHMYGSPHYVEVTYTTGAVSGANITSPTHQTTHTVPAGERKAIFVQAMTGSGGEGVLNQKDLRVDFNVSGSGTAAPSGWQNASFSEYPGFPIQESNATHAWVYTNSSGIAAIYLNVSTYEGATHNITASVNPAGETDTWNNTYNDTVNITTVNATRAKISLSADRLSAQSGEAEADYNWITITATLKDAYNNTVEDPGIIIDFSDNRSEVGFGIFNKTSATTDSNGNATVGIRSQKAGPINVTATNASLQSDSIDVMFYGIPKTIKAEATSVDTNTANNSINVTVSVVDADGYVYQRLGELPESQRYVNVSVNTTYNSSSAGIYNESGGAVNVTGNWGDDTVSINLTNGKGYILINDTTAESVLVQVWSTGLKAVYPDLESSNASLRFTPGATKKLNVTNVTASTVKYGENIKLKVMAKDDYGNTNTSSQADLLPVKVQFNRTEVSVVDTTLVNSSEGVNATGKPYIMGRLTNGEATVTITASKACNVNARASTTVSGIETGATADLTFESKPWVAINVETNRNVIVYNGTDKAIINITLLDAAGNLDTNPTNTSDVITIATTGGTLNKTTATLGEFTGKGYLNNISLTATTGPNTVYAYNATIMSSVNATVDVAGYPARFTVTPASSTVDEGSNVTLTVNLTDLNGNPVSFNCNFNITVTNVSGKAVLWNGSVAGPTVTGITSLKTGGNSSIELTGIEPGTVNLSVNTSSFNGIESVNVTEITVESTAFDDKLRLKPGWNFISVPKKQDSTKDTFGELLAGWTGWTVYKYDPTTSPYWFALTGSDSINDDVLAGYWVHVDTAGTIELSYKEASYLTPPSKALTGNAWNAIGFSNTTAMSANATLKSVEGSWSTVLGWDATNQKYENAIIYEVNDGTNMEPGKGYWIWMTKDDTLSAISA